MKRREAFFRLVAQGLGGASLFNMASTLEEACTYGGTGIELGLLYGLPVVALDAGIALALLAALTGLDALITRARLLRALRREASAFGVGAVQGLLLYVVMTYLMRLILG